MKLFPIPDKLNRSSSDCPFYVATREALRTGSSIDTSLLLQMDHSLENIQRLVSPGVLFFEKTI